MCITFDRSFMTPCEVPFSFSPGDWLHQPGIQSEDDGNSIAPNHSSRIVTKMRKQRLGDCSSGIVYYCGVP